MSGRRALLIVAHPGHELLLHHWLERARPIVCALTDGSGSRAQDRSGRSRTTIERAGARVGPVFAAATDREWYRAILTGDRRLFDEAAAHIADLCRAEGVTQVVGDALEFFNPMHDLCSGLAQHVALRLQESGIREEVLDDACRIYHLEHEKGSGWTPEGEQALRARIAASGISWVEWTTVVVWASYMQWLGRPLVFNLENWGFRDADLPEAQFPAEPSYVRP